MLPVTANTRSTPTVDALSRMSFEGNITPELWYRNIRYEGSKKAALPAIAILGEIVYWYRPKEVRDEATGYLVGYVKKFGGDKLQRSYQSLADKFGLSKRQATEHCHLLEDLGLIDLELRTVTTKTGLKISNVLFIDLFPDVLKRYTYELIDPKLLEDEDEFVDEEGLSHLDVIPITSNGLEAETPRNQLSHSNVIAITSPPITFECDPLSHSNVIPPPLECETNTETTTEITYRDQRKRKTRTREEKAAQDNPALIAGSDQNSDAQPETPIEAAGCVNFSEKEKASQPDELTGFGIDAPYWEIHKAPWKQDRRHYQERMLFGVARVSPKADCFRLESGNRNDYAISAHLHKLEQSAQTFFGEATIAARSKLLDYWQAGLQASRTAPPNSKPPQSAPGAPESDGNSTSDYHAHLLRQVAAERLQELQELQRADARSRHGLVGRRRSPATASNS